MLSFNLIIIILILLFISLLVFHKNLILLLNMEEFGLLVYLLPLVILFSGSMEINEQWLLRTGQFKIVANTKLWRSILVNGGRLGGGLYSPHAYILIVLVALENALRTFLIKIQLRSSNKKLYIFNVKHKSLYKLAREYKDFPMYRAPQITIDRVSQNLPVLLLTSFFSPTAAGFFTIGRTVLNVPSQLIGKSIGDVFYPKISEAINNKQNVVRLILKSTFGLFIIGMIPYGIIVCFGPHIFEIAFGKDWFIAGEFARWMAIWSFFTLLDRPSTRALPAFHAQRFQLIYAVITLIVRVASFLVAYYLFADSTIAIAFFSIVASLLSLILILITLKIGTTIDEYNEV